MPQSQTPDPTIDNHFLVVNSMNTLSAFLSIGHLLQIPCVQHIGFHINNTLITTLPSSLRPTIQQQIVPHKAYIDMLPWASIRDRIITSIPTIDEQNLFEDLLVSDFKVWGRIPWDPMGWEVGKDFASKWWFLLDEGILRTTNFWRSQRGEEDLVVSVA